MDASLSIRSKTIGKLSERKVYRTQGHSGDFHTCVKN